MYVHFIRQCCSTIYRLFPSRCCVTRWCSECCRGGNPDLHASRADEALWSHAALVWWLTKERKHAIPVTNPRNRIDYYIVLRGTRFLPPTEYSGVENGNWLRAGSCEEEAQRREDLRGKVSYIKINGEGPITPVADMETLARMVRLLRKDGAAELFQG